MCVECLCKTLRDDWRNFRLIWVVGRVDEVRMFEINNKKSHSTLITRNSIIKTIVCARKGNNQLQTANGFQYFKSNAISTSTLVDTNPGRQQTSF